MKTFECEKGFSYTVFMVSKKIPQDGITLNSFLELVGELGMLITCMVLAAPFLIPISIPGTGVLVGIIVLMISLSIMIDKFYLVPDRLLNHEMSYKHLLKILNASIKMLTFLEKYMKPRYLIMTNKRYSNTANNIFFSCEFSTVYCSITNSFYKYITRFGNLFFVSRNTRMRGLPNSVGLSGGYNHCNLLHSYDNSWIKITV